MREPITSFLLGLLFATGLVISGMADPQKVLNFLKFWAEWDPSLAFVMMGALSVSIGFRLATSKRTAPVLAETFQVPTKKDIDSSLLIGATMFGVGWGMVGVCPGPALTNFAQLNVPFMSFIASMIVGMLVFKGFLAKLLVKGK